MSLTENLVHNIIFYLVADNTMDNLLVFQLNTIFFMLWLALADELVVSFE